MNSDVERLISDLEFEYDVDNGFLGLLRYGTFDVVARDRYLRLLESIELGEAESIDRRLVALLWSMPLIVEWQARRHEGKAEHAALVDVGNKVLTEIERILGIP